MNERELLLSEFPKAEFRNSFDFHACFSLGPGYCEVFQFSNGIWKAAIAFLPGTDSFAENSFPEILKRLVEIRNRWEQIRFRRAIAISAILARLKESKHLQYKVTSFVTNDITTESINPMDWNSIEISYGWRHDLPHGITVLANSIEFNENRKFNPLRPTHIYQGFSEDTIERVLRRI